MCVAIAGFFSGGVNYLEGAVGAEFDLDLLGDKMGPVRDPRGRPRFKKDKENQLLVINLRAANWNHEQIAVFMGCDPKTLRANFSRELEHGALFLEGIALQSLTKGMLAGNVTAAKRVLEIAQSSNAATRLKVDRLVKDVPLGKKDQLKRDASTPPAGWGDLLPKH